MDRYNVSHLQSHPIGSLLQYLLWSPEVFDNNIHVFYVSSLFNLALASRLQLFPWTGRRLHWGSSEQNGELCRFYGPLKRLDALQREHSHGAIKAIGGKHGSIPLSSCK